MSHQARLALVLGIVALGACDSGTEPTPPPTPGTPAPAPGVPAPAPTATPPSGDDRAILINAFRQSQTRKMRVRATMNVTEGEHQGTSSWLALIVPPDLKSMDMTLPTGQHMQMTVAGERVWMRMGTAGAYREMPVAIGAATSRVPQFEAEFLRQLDTGEATFTRAASEPLDGQPMTVFNLTATAPPGMSPGPPSPVTGRVWIAADGLVRKFDGDASRPAAHVTILYEYDDSITITIPPT